MTISADAHELTELLEREFTYLFQLAGTPRLIRLRRVLEFISAEPRLASLVSDAQEESDAALRRYESLDASIRGDLLALWQGHRRAMADVLADGDDALDAYGSRQGFDARLGTPTPLTMPPPHRDAERAHETESLIHAVRHWAKTATQRQAIRPPTSPHPLDGLEVALGRLLDRIGYASRQLREASESLLAPAFDRLSRDAHLSNPAPPSSPGLEEWLDFHSANEFARTARVADEGGASDVERTTLDDIYNRVDRDARLLHQELRFRIGMGRTRLALIRRYAARCHAFDAAELRAICNEGRYNAERRLTQHFGRYLFDQGLLPIIDPTLGGLRPDILHVQGEPLYIEAKQYANSAPRSQIVKAYSQVWSTWSRLRNDYPRLREAFLVVFRRSGPLFHPPPLLRGHGLALHSVVVDISSTGGSREKMTGITVDASELVPRTIEEGKTRTVSGARRARR